MIVARVGRWAVAAGVLLTLGGCASGAWREAEGGAALGRASVPMDLPAHRAVERITLRIRGHEFEFVGYRTCDPATRDVRAQLLLDSGISVLDVAVRGGDGERISGSVFEAIPHLAEITMEDLRRTWGSRSAFCARSHLPFSFGGNTVGFPLPSRLTDGQRTYQAREVDDGSWVAAAPREPGQAGPFRVTLLDAKLVPEATIDYSDFDEDGVPREIHLVDLRDGHTLDVEVEEVRLAEAKE